MDSIIKAHNKLLIELNYYTHHEKLLNTLGLYRYLLNKQMAEMTLMRDLYHREM